MRDRYIQLQSLEIRWKNLLNINLQFHQNFQNFYYHHYHHFQIPIPHFHSLILHYQNVDILRSPIGQILHLDGYCGIGDVCDGYESGFGVV